MFSRHFFKMNHGAMFLLQWVFFPSFMATSESLSEFLTQTEEQLTPRTTPLSKAHPVVTQRDFAKAVLN